MYGGANTKQNPEATAQQSAYKDATIARQQQQLNNYQSQPVKPKWESLLGTNGQLQQQFQVKNHLNQDYLGRLRQEGLRDPAQQSQWRMLMQQQIGMDRLASNGGLRSGAGERLGRQGALQGLLAQQRVRQQGLDYDIADNQNRLGALQNLGQQELAAADFSRNIQEGNINRTLQETTQKRFADLESYREQMQAWAAERTADATPSGGGKK